MADDWIKMRSNLDTNPHVIQLASLLGTSELHVVGCLWKVWSWADAHSLDGNAIRVTDVTLDRFTGVTGFAHAMREVGWLDGADGHITFPRFAEHNGQTAKKRAETAKRVAKHRNAKPVTGVTQKVLPEKRREEKRREDIITPPTPSDANGDGAPAGSVPDKPKRERFVKPTIEEVREFCRNRNNGIDAEEFIAFYESKGWMVGKSPMKNWRSAVVTWEKGRARDQSQPAKPAGPSVHDLYPPFKAQPLNRPQQ